MPVKPTSQADPTRNALRSPAVFLDQSAAVGPSRSAKDLTQAPWIVIWETTRACDLACLHCRASAQPDRDSQELTTTEARHLLRHIREEFGRVLLVLTGGDPMKRPDIYDLIAYANELGLIVALAPSATPLLTDAALEQAKDAGLHRNLTEYRWTQCPGS